MKHLIFAALALAFLAAPAAHAAPPPADQACHALADAGATIAELRDAGQPLEVAVATINTVYDMQPADVQDQRAPMIAAAATIYGDRSTRPMTLYLKLYTVCMDAARDRMRGRLPR